jgi:mannose-6-phosphate isomerase class I
MPLLIKLNQALGNSFQLHIPYEIKSDRWIPKPETWFYFEDGLASMGLKAGADVAAYKKTCLEIERQMQELSAKVRSGALPLDEARMQAQKMVHAQNPWQFVNVIEVKKGDVVDPSAGGIHHSWEEDTTRFPLGNVVFEIQLDAMDPVATIRSFDQGKIKDDGSVRAMNIEDYFTYLKTDSDSNDVARLCTHPSGDELIKTDYYRLQRMRVEGSRTVGLEGSFHCVHCYAGSLTIRAGEGEVHIHTGHTAFIPAGCGQYTLHSDTQATALVGSVV